MSEPETEQRSLGKRANEINASIRYTMWSVFRLATVLGVRPAEPGFKSVRIAPHLGALQRAEGRVPHPLGAIDVRLARTAGGGLRGEITLPQGLAGVVAWGGKEIALGPGRQTLSF